MKNTLRLITLALFSTLALAASVPYTFTAGAPAVAAEVNANFSALANAITALEARVATLESASGALTAADVAGTYKMVSLSNALKSDSVLQFSSSAAVGDFTLVLGADGTFSATGSSKSTQFSGKTTQCNSASTGATTSSGPSTSGGAGSHFHQYTYQTCTTGGFVNGSSQSDPVTDSGSWALAGTDSITVTPSNGAPFTVYMSKPGRVGFVVQAEDQSDSNGTGRQYSMTVLIKR